jgi:pyruvate dehydrogenase E1 component alpha subunit
MTVPDPLAGARRVVDDDGEIVPPEAPLLSAQARLKLYRELRRARRLDERLGELQRQGVIGFFGSSLGQEAVPVDVYREKPWNLVEQSEGPGARTARAE